MVGDRLLTGLRDVTSDLVEDAFLTYLRKLDEIARLDIVEHQADFTRFEIECGKGTYVRSLARDIGRDLGCYGYSRSDMILTPAGPIFLETNTLPGLSKSSFVPQQLTARGIALADFVGEQLQLAMKRPQGA